MYMCVNAERGTHQCTYTYRYIAKPVKSSLSSFRPARTHEREPSTNEREPMHAPLRVSVSYPACLRRLERRLVFIVGTLKHKRAKERLDVWYTYVYICKYTCVIYTVLLWAAVSCLSACCVLLWAACLHVVCCCVMLCALVITVVVLQSSLSSCCSHHCRRAIVIAVLVLQSSLSSLLPAPPQPPKRLSKYTYTREPMHVFLWVSVHTPACLGGF